MPGEIYEAFMNPKKHAEFTGSKATCDAKVGGSFTAWDGYISGKNLELEKGKKIVQEWITSDWPQCYPPSRLELIFKKLENCTEISMIHSGVPKEKVEDLKNGWINFYWNPLENYLKNGTNLE
jgi:activator of HSP90 ATPase